MHQKNSVVTIGTFDGIHKGHQLLISTMLKSAKKNNYRSIIIALEKPIKNISGVLTLPDEKVETLKNFGSDEIIILPVPSDILQRTPQEFFEDFLMDYLNIKEIICGIDFAFGKNRKGNLDWLKKKSKENNIKLNIIKPLKLASKQISSSYIRSEIEKGDILKVNKMLGRNYSFNGIHFREKGLASKMGFPTINLKVEKEKLLPRGVFLSLVIKKEKIYPAITNMGCRPTVTTNKTIVPEIHILGFKGEWKNKEVKVELIKKLRDEKKFNSLDELKKQISKDKTTAIKYFSR